jgi:hypothetical protein
MVQDMAEPSVVEMPDLIGSRIPPGLGGYFLVALAAGLAARARGADTAFAAALPVAGLAFAVAFGAGAFIGAFLAGGFDATAFFAGALGLATFAAAASAVAMVFYILRNSRLNSSVMVSGSGTRWASPMTVSPAMPL